MLKRPAMFVMTTVLAALVSTKCSEMSNLYAAQAFDPFHETPAEYNVRAQWLRDAKLGVFIHWNPSSVIGKDISWCRNDYGREKYDTPVVNAFQLFGR